MTHTKENPQYCIKWYLENQRRQMVCKGKSDTRTEGVVPCGNDQHNTKGLWVDVCRWRKSCYLSSHLPETQNISNQYKLHSQYASERHLPHLMILPFPVSSNFSNSLGHVYMSLSPVKSALGHQGHTRGKRQATKIN